MLITFVIILKIFTLIYAKSLEKKAIIDFVFVQKNVVPYVKRSQVRSNYITSSVSSSVSSPPPAAAFIRFPTGPEGGTDHIYSLRFPGREESEQQPEVAHKSAGVG